MIKVSSVSQFQASLNPVQPLPDAVNGVPVLNDFRVIAGFIPGDSGKSGLYAAQTRHDLVVAFAGGVQLRTNLPELLQYQIVFRHT